MYRVQSTLKQVTKPASNVVVSPKVNLLSSNTVAFGNSETPETDLFDLNIPANQVFWKDQFKDINALGDQAAQFLMMAIHRNDGALFQQLVKIHRATAETTVSSSSSPNEDTLQLLRAEIPTFKVLTKRLEAEIPKNVPSILYAIRKGRWEMAKQLIELGVALETKGIDGKTPLIEALHYSVPFGLSIYLEPKNQFIQWLIDRGSSVSAQTVSGRTPLHFAVNTENPEMTQCLLAKGADMMVKDLEMHSPLESAISRLHPKICRIFAQKGAIISPSVIEELKNTAISKNDLESFLYFNQKRPGSVSLVNAISKVDPLFVKTLLDLGVDVGITDPGGNSLLELAILSNREDLIPMLIEAGTPVTVKEGHRDILLQGVKTQKLSLLKTLVSAIQQKYPEFYLDWLSPSGSANGNASGNEPLTPLEAAVTSRETEVRDWVWEQAEQQLQQHPELFNTSSGLIHPEETSSNKISQLALFLNHTTRQNLLSQLLTKAHLLQEREEKDQQLEKTTALMANFVIKALPEAGLVPILNKKTPMTPLARRMEWLLEKGISPNAVDIHGDTPLHHLATSPGVRHHVNTLFPLFLEYGANPSAQNVNQQTPLHQACASGNEEMVKLLLACPTVLVNGQDDQGKTPIWFAAEENNQKIVSLLAAHQADLNPKNIKGQTLLNLLFQKLLKDPSNINHRLDMIQKVRDMGAKDFAEEPEMETLLNRFALSGNHPQALSVFKSLGVKESAFVKAVQDLWAVMTTPVSRNPETAAGILPANIIAELNGNSLGHPKANLMASLMPQLMWNHPITDLHQLFQLSERFFDNNRPLRNFHPNEAELMLLIKHPDLLDRPQGKINSLSTCLTSISHFIDTGAQLSDKTLKTWGELGFLTHGFRFWRFDALGGSKSLLAQFGFKPFPDPRPFDNVFGKGFLYKDKASGAWVEFRRGYLLVTHPDDGTLVVRNSSPAFGRDLLRHPAYYLKTPLTLSDLNAFDPRTLKDSDSVLHRQHYPPRMGNVSSSSQGADAIAALTEILLKVKDDYRKFKLDTEGFDPQGQFTGHLSPGLGKMVDFLNRAKAQGKPLPDLAFVNPEYPIYQPYSFGEDASGKLVNRLKITPSILKELNHFVLGGWTEEKYPDSVWLQFIKMAGVENRGELVMLSPEVEDATTLF
ncbi:MAG: ankyrin repeat domain-containing protein [Cyanobacteria bacterium]|nr:ankyrin repeat domain-containing protein [Cyanobacteriota bacterium]